MAQTCRACTKAPDGDAVASDEWLVNNEGTRVFSIEGMATQNASKNRAA